MKFRTFTLALAALGSSSAAQPGSEADAGPRGADLAGLVAAELRARVPMGMGPGIRLVAARSEGSTLVQTFEVPGPQFDYARQENAAAGAGFREGFCRTPSRILFERGVSLRVEVTDGSRSALALPLITDCPPTQ